MQLPPGTRYELLSPFDPAQQPGRPPRIYPFHLMEVGDWFAVHNCTPQQQSSIRGCAGKFLKCGEIGRRFSVRYCRELGLDTVVCARTA